MLSDAYITALFDAVVEATEEAIVNAMLGAETMVGRDGITAHALPGERLARGAQRIPARRLTGGRRRLATMSTRPVALSPARHWRPPPAACEDFMTRLDGGSARWP